MVNPFNLNNKVVVVTGGTGLLGNVYCRGLAKLGASVVVADLANTEPRKRALDISKKSRTRVLGFECDVSSEEQVIKLFEHTLNEFGKVDVVLNNAAATGEHLQRVGAPFTTFEESTLDIWEATIRINLTGVYLVAREAGKAMLKTGKGSLINVSSTYGVVGPDHRIYEGMKFNSLASYAAAKAGVHGLTRWLASYWGSKGIRVNTLVPGGVGNLQENTFVERYSERTPLGRMAKPEEMLGMVAFLASDASSYCTGQQYFVDGGWTAV